MSTICCPRFPYSPDEEVWKSQYLTQLQSYMIPSYDLPSGSRWGRLICTWNEKRPNGALSTHHIAFVYDHKEPGLYLDSRAIDIFKKCFVQLCARPLHILAKTIYHVSMVPLFEEARKVYKKKQSMGEGIRNSFRSLADIIRTPIYGAVLIIASFAALTMALFDRKSIYDSRELLGKIEQSANWGERHTPLALTKCFQPFYLTIFEHHGDESHDEDTFYPSRDPLEMQMTNLARRHILHQRNPKYHLPLIGKPLDPNVTYISPYLLEP